MSLLPRNGILGHDLNLESRSFSDLKKIKETADGLRTLGLKVVLTQGTFDMVHIGHARYLSDARKLGDFLIVGVDSDKKVRKRKGPDRPVVPEEERMEMLVNLRSVDAVFLKDLGMPKWALIRAVRPDLLIATDKTYSKSQLKDLKKHCKEVKVMRPKATTSTSAKIRLLQIGTAKKLEESLTPKILSSLKEVLEGVGNDGEQKNKK